MRRLKRYLAVFVLIPLGLLYWLLPIEVRPAPPPDHPAPPPVLTLEAVQSLSKLVTTRLILHQDASVVSEGWLGELTVRWDGTGSVLLGPDLAQARITDRKDDDRTATIVLPNPKVLAATLDLEHGQMTATFDGLWQLSPSAKLQADQQAALLARAQERLRKVLTREQITHAKATAETAVRRLSQSLQWDLRVQWDVARAGATIEVEPARAGAIVLAIGNRVRFDWYSEDKGFEPQSKLP